MSLPSFIKITEVGPRDGLQNEKAIIPTEAKKEFILKLIEAGFSQIEVGSFVSPQWVPQMADTAEILKALPTSSQTRFIVLVPNFKGFEKSLQHSVRSIAVFTAASETFNKKNINRSIEESFQDIEKIVTAAKQENIWVRGYLSTCFGCPYEGKVDPQKVVELSQRLYDFGVDELSIGDTIGVATPRAVEQLLPLLSKKIPSDQIALHFHDTRGMAIVNIYAALQMGFNHFDSSVGGLGGCPYAPGASGNVATEDLLYLLEGLGIKSGVDLSKVAEASQKISQTLQRTLPSRYLQAISRKS